MKRILSLIILLFAAELAHGQLITHYGVVKDGYNFWVAMPDGCTAADSTKIPAVVFLHGRSLCGTNLNNVLRYGTFDALKFTGLNIPAVIIAPQNPGGAWSPKKLMNILEWATDHYPVDTNRVYVLGMSLGGYGTIDFAGTYPDRIAAAMALCGGGTLKDYSGLNEVPLWIIHGYADNAVSWKESEKVVNKLAASGDTSRLRHDFMQGVNHGRLARCFYMQSTYDWLFSHNLQDSARTLNRDYSITSNALENAYRAFSGKPKRTLTSKNFNNATGVSTEPQQVVAAKSSKSSNSGTKSSSPKYITVKKGDTLSKIASREHTTVDKLCALNGLKRTSVIRAGRKLRVK